MADNADGIHAGRANYFIEYSRDALEHIRFMTARRQRIVLEAIDRCLSHEADIETRNRKPMRSNPLAPWELRIGDIRVYYDIKGQPVRSVVILAVGIKDRDRVRIGKEVYKL